MIHRGIASFGLDYGHCPPWLFDRMVKLGRAMVHVLIAEYGPDEFIRRMADPAWFQSLGTVLAFDWNASGLTTILTAALKEAIRGEERDLGIFICGGKGKTSRKTPEEILQWGERLSLADGQAQKLVYNSKMSAKVDSALVQDGFQLYHHSFIFSIGKKPIDPAKPVSGEAGQALLRSAGGASDFAKSTPDKSRGTPHYAETASKGTQITAWTVVQQGMNVEKGAARRYHWFSEDVNDLVSDPHSGISSPVVLNRVLDLAAKGSLKTRNISTELVQAGYAPLMKDINLIRRFSSNLSQASLFENQEGMRLALLNLETKEFKSHPVVREDFSKSKYLEKVLSLVTDRKPENYEALVAMPGVGPKTLRALALVGEVVYGAKPSYEDPARYSFAHGGKDATPYPVDKPTYDQTIQILASAVRKAALPIDEKRKAMGRLFGE